MPKITIPGSDEDLRRALQDVNLPHDTDEVLEHLTGDPRWLSERYTPVPIVAPEGSMFPDDSGGYSDEIAEEIRAAAFDVLARARDEQPELLPPPTLEQMIERMSFSVAEPVGAEFAKMLMEETGFVDRDEQWRAPLREALAEDLVRDFSVIVVGAGMSGICTGIKLKEAGIDYVILEKNDAVGGTWYENTYPDCGVDTPNHFYSYSFERNPNWSGYFSKRDELYQYFERCTDQFGIRDHIQLSTEVQKMHFDAGTRQWHVTVKRLNGKEEVLSANAVVSAVGQLNRPVIPSFEGLDTFRGESFHSARWQHDVSLEGKKVAVIGTGCSAVQLVPKTADAASHLTVFQRSPHWISPNRDYYRPVEDGLKWALNHIPRYAEWHRARMILSFMDRNWQAVPGDPNWAHKERAMNEANDGLRASITAYISEQLGDRQDLLEKCVPDFPVFGKRLIIDNNWYAEHRARQCRPGGPSGIARFTPGRIRDRRRHSARGRCGHLRHRL